MNATAATPGTPAGWLRRTAWARRALAGSVVIGAGVLWWSAPRDDRLPDFSVYEDIAQRKEAFFDYLLPHVREVNAAVMRDRRRLLDIRDELARRGGTGFFNERWLRRLAADYDLEPPENLDAEFADRLLLRVDIIPPSLALAQAANESAWGTSRFARQGNNLFGMRTYEGEGMVPQRRTAGKTFKVAAYPSVRASITAYEANLNTHFRYRRLRLIRAELRNQGKPVSGHALADGLLAYSTRGSDYVAVIQSMIRTNNLARFDE